MTVKKPAASTPLWGEKPYRSLDYEWKKQYGEKIYKVSLNGGMTCPNRDGTVGSGGCIFCSAGGSGDFAADARLSIREQIESQEEKLRTKFPAKHFVAYFQAYTNTYAPVDYLRKIFTEAITHPDIVALSIGTRPDCLPDDVLDLLSSLNEIKPVTIELGLQTIHEKTAAFIRRGYALPCFEEAVQKLRSCGISVVVHTILGLPGETEEDMLRYDPLSQSPGYPGHQASASSRSEGDRSGCLVRKPGLSRFYRGGIYRSCDPLHRRTFTGYHDSPSHRRRPQRASHCPALEQPEALSPQ